MLGAFGEVPGGGRRLPDWAVPVIGWLAIVFFGPFMALHLYKAVTGGISVRIDESGMLLRDYSNKTIPWDDFTALSTQNMMGTNMLLFEVVDASEAEFGWFRRMTMPMNRSINGYGNSVVVNNTDRSPAELLDAIAQFAPPRLLR